MPSPCQLINHCEGAFAQCFHNFTALRPHAPNFARGMGRAQTVLLAITEKRRCMFQTFEQVRKFLDDHQIQMVDLKFTDLWGRWHHLTVPSSQFSPQLLENGIGFDGSAAVLKSVKAGDMVLV